MNDGRIGTSGWEEWNINGTRQAEELQEELLRIHAEQGGTMAMVTHDIEEAVYLADRIVVMSSRPGKIEEIVEMQLGRPRDRGSADFAWYKKRVYDHFIKSKQKGPEYVI